MQVVQGSVGQGDPAYGMSLLNLATVYVRLCSFDVAFSLQQEAHALLQELCGERHGMTKYAAQNIEFTRHLLLDDNLREQHTSSVHRICARCKTIGGIDTFVRCSKCRAVYCKWQLCAFFGFVYPFYKTAPWSVSIIIGPRTGHRAWQEESESVHK